MTREEAIECWEGLRKTFSSQLEKEENHFGRMHLQTSIDAVCMAISALQKQDQSPDSGKMMPLIVSCLKGRIKTAGGCVWKYEDGAAHAPH